MSGLGQINLIVGNNNSGKTSILEAIYLLANAGDMAALWKMISQRGEQMTFEDNLSSSGRALRIEMDICHIWN